MDKNNLDKNNCTDIYLNILRLLDSNRFSSPERIILELQKTSKCDYLSNLSDVRNKINSCIGESQLNRILSQRQQLGNNEWAGYAIAHYGNWLHERVLGSLSWYEWTIYKHLCIKKLLRSVSYSEGGWRGKIL